MPFTPKFVDLVRNLTSVQGSGPVTLGAAVAGYTGLAAALVTGDQFYYCIQGVDKPAEREVGRGTMLAGGTIAREAVSGGLTNFSAGIKTIALVAAAEWFTRLDQGGGAAPFDVASRTLLAATSTAGARPAFLAEAGREGLFVFDPSDLSAKVAADAAQAMVIAPASAPTGASGAWVRKHDGAVSVKWFGAVGDNATNDGTAFVAAIAYLKAVASSGFGYGKGSGKLLVPAGQYFLGATTLDITHTITIEGEGSGGGGGPSTVLRWSGATGIRVQMNNTVGAAGTQVAAPSRGGGSIFTRLCLVGGWSAGEAEYHGIQLRDNATIRDCWIENFEGDAIHIYATSGGSPDGNANIFTIDTVFVSGCRDGLFVKGADANAGQVHGLNVNYSRRWGIYDSSFLGNTYTACHVALCGLWIGGTPTVVAHGGFHYSIVAGQAAGASINPPSGMPTDNAYWVYLQAGAVDPALNIPAWTNGMAAREGGAYKTDNINARNVFVGCYSESGQGASQFVSPTVVISGLHGAPIKGDAAYVRSSGGYTTIDRLNVAAELVSSGGYTEFGPSGGAPADSVFNLNATNFYNFLNFRSWAGGVPQTDGSIKSSRGDQSLHVGGKANVVLTSNDSPVAYAAANGFFVTKPLGYLHAGLGVGGTVEQATNKATGMTLNKSTGQITLSAAALPAATGVSFTLTNSTVAAVDTVIVNIGSGAAAASYTAQVDAVAAGSCRLHLRNVSAGALSEALVLNFTVIKGATA